MDMYTHQLHTSTLRQFIQKLQLRHITLVVQDWGGLTGLSVLPSIDHCVDRLVIMNTGVPPNGRTSGRSVVNFLTWRAVVMACGTYLPVDYIFKLACTNKAYQISDCASPRTVASSQCVVSLTSLPSWPSHPCLPTCVCYVRYCCCGQRPWQATARRSPLHGFALVSRNGRCWCRSAVPTHLWSSLGVTWIPLVTFLKPGLAPLW
jgi:hypothetical protein